MEENNNKGFEVVNPNLNQTNGQPEKPKKKSKLVPFLLTIILILMLALGLCIWNMYAMSKGHDNLLIMLGTMLSGKEVVNGEKINNEDDVVEREEESNIVIEDEPNNERVETLTTEEAKKIIQGYLNISSSKESSSIKMLQIEEIALIKDYTEWNQMNNKNEKDEEYFVKTNIKYSELESKILNYMTEELFEEYAYNYKNVDGILWVRETGASGYSVEVKNVKEIDSTNNTITYEVDYKTISFNDIEENRNEKFKLKKNESGKFVVSDWGWDIKVKEALQNYLDLAGVYEGSPSNLLVKLNLLKAEDINYVDTATDSDGFVKSNIKYSEYKEAMLNYVSESLFNERFTALYKEKAGYLYYHNGGGTGRKIKVESIGKYSDGLYNATVYNIGVDGDKSDTYNIKFNVETYNEKYVISYYK